MSSRLWLAVAVVLASGASPARAETPMIAVTLDQAKVARLPHGTATLIVGNPMIADVTMLKNGNSHESERVCGASRNLDSFRIALI
jgi:Pilus formation protein N terminal region